MNTKSLIYKVLVLLVAALVVNQIACSKASFNKSEDTSQSSPGDDFGDTDRDDDDEKTVRCSDEFPQICDVGDTGLRTDRRSDFDNDDNCFRTRYTFSSFDYALESKVVKFYIYDTDDNRLSSSDIEYIDGMYTMVVQVDGRYVGYDKELFRRTSQVAPTSMARVVSLRYCLKE